MMHKENEIINDLVKDFDEKMQIDQNLNDQIASQSIDKIFKPKFIPKKDRKAKLTSIKGKGMMIRD